jgi:uncharacterized protein (TIGR04222 family)
MAAMTMWLVLGAVVAVAGIGTSAALWLAELRPRLSSARAELAHGLERGDLAVLSGGPARRIDAEVVDFVERGLVRADDGRLAVTDDVDRLLDTPVDAPAYQSSWSMEEAMTLVAVRRDGADGIDAVRRGVVPFASRRRVRRLAERGLLVTPLRRKWGPMSVAGPTLLGLFGCSMAAVTSAPAFASDWPAAISIFAWLPVTAATAYLYTRRPGYSGPDPRTRRGRDVTTVAAEAPAAGQADFVARGGFAAMTDRGRRAAVQGDAVDSRWNAGRRVGAHSDVNALVAVQGVDGDGGGADGGGGGD